VGLQVRRFGVTSDRHDFGQADLGVLRMELTERFRIGLYINVAVSVLPCNGKLHKASESCPSHNTFVLASSSGCNTLAPNG